ncbi:MAG TPA: phage portal protein [Phycisphaerales bacterium]|nr:phage portal protein [Phycisphaerales bacterium]
MATPRLSTLKSDIQRRTLEVAALKLQAEAAALTRFNSATMSAGDTYRPLPRRRGFETLIDTARKEGSRKLGGSGNAHLTPREHQRLLAAGRDACRNNPLAAGLKRCKAQLTVGNGLRFKSLSADPEFRAWIEAEVDDRFEHADVSGRYGQLDMDLWQAGEPIDAGACYINLIGGDDPDTGRVQLLEAEEIAPGTAEQQARSPYGVERDSVGRLMRLYSRPFPVGRPGEPLLLPAGYAQEVDGGSVLVCEHLPRKSYTVGVPAIGPSIGVMDDAWDFLKAVLAAAELGAKLPLISRTGSPAAMKSQMPGFVEQDSRTGVDPAEAKAVDLPDGASVLHLMSDDKIEAVMSGHPQTQVPEFVRMMSQLFGAPLGVPIELVLMAFLGISYSGARALIYMAYENAEPERRRIKRNKSRMFTWWLPAIVDKRRAEGKKVPDDFALHTFRNPTRLSLDPLKEAQANKINVDENFTTKARVQEDNDHDPDACDEQRSREKKRDKALGITPVAAPGAVPADKGENADQPVGSAAR